MKARKTSFKFIATFTIISTVFGLTMPRHTILAAELDTNYSSAYLKSYVSGDKEHVNANFAIFRSPLRAYTQIPTILDQYSMWDLNNLPKTFFGGGTYHAGPAIHTLVEDLNGDNRPEIFVTGLATGPLYSFDWQGNPLPGWVGGKSLSSNGAHYPVAYKSPSLSGIVTGNFGDHLGMFDFNGNLLWERPNNNFITTPPSIANINPNNGGNASIHLGEEDWKVHGRNIATGLEFASWPRMGMQSQEQHTPAIADIDNDGEIEIIAASGASTSGIDIMAMEANGTVKWTYELPNGEVDTYPIVADLDLDNDLEIIVISEDTSSPWNDNIEILDHNGNNVWHYDLAQGTSYGTAPALGDLDGDNIPEIVVQLESTLHAIKPFVGQLPGWPVNLAASGISMWMGESAPVIGDLDIDQKPEIVVTTNKAGSGSDGYVHVIQADGTYHDLVGGPVKMNIGSGAVPVITDLDYDTHNEFVIRSTYWDGFSGTYDTLWAFEFFKDSKAKASGPIYWGQFMHDAQHTGLYQAPQI